MAYPQKDISKRGQIRSITYPNIFRSIIFFSNQMIRFENIPSIIIQRMSSIISDIFFNPNNNGLLDNLLNRDLTPDYSQTHQNSATILANHLISLHFAIKIIPMSKYSSSSTHLLRIQLGRLGDQDRVQVKRDSSMQGGLQLHGIDAQSINTHSHFRIELVKSSASSSLGFYCVPMENIKEMLINGNKEKTVMGTLCTPSQTRKFKIECLMRLYDRSQDSISPHSHSKHILNEESKFDSPSFPQLDQKPVKVVRPVKKERKDLSIQRASSKNWSDLLDRGKESPNTTQKILKFTNKTIKFCIRRVQIEHKEATDEQFICQIQSHKGDTNHEYSLGQTIILNSTEFGQNGINLLVKNRDTKQILGFCHLNPVALMGSESVQGIFPILELDNHRYRGLLTLCPDNQQAQQKINGEPSFDCHLKKDQSSLQQKQGNDHYSSLAIELPKILFMGLEQMNFEQFEDKPPSIVVRISDGSSQFVHMEKQNLKIRSCGNGFMGEYIVPSIVVMPVSKLFEGQVKIQLEIYSGYQLIGYTEQIIILPSEEAQENQIFYQSRTMNMTAENYVCQGIANILIMQCHSDYILPNRVHLTLQILSDPVLYSLLSSFPDEEKIINWMLAKYEGLIYIQAHRTCRLLLACHQFRRIKVVETPGNLAEAYSPKLLKELLYLDNNFKGVISLKDIIQVSSFYRLQKSFCESWIQSTRRPECPSEVLYLFLLIGLEKETICICVPSLVKNRVQKDKKEDLKVSPQKIEQQKSEQKIISIKKEPVHQQNEPKIINLHVQKIECQNLHKLMNGQAIPSIKLSFPKQGFMNRPSYSNANPQIRLNRQLEHGESLIVLHHSIKQKKDIQLASLVINIQQREYSLGKGAILKLILLEKKETV